MELEKLNLTELNTLKNYLISYIDIRQKIIDTNQKAEVSDLDMSASIVNDEINKLLRR